MIKVDVESEFAPIIGTEKQSEELVRYLMQDFEDDPLSKIHIVQKGDSLWKIAEKYGVDFERK